MEYTIENCVKSFSLINLTLFILCINLVPKESPIITIIQVFFLGLWAYWAHRLLHILPESPYNYHIYSHHNKKLNGNKHKIPHR
jgi:hypothetical protein